MNNNFKIFRKFRTGISGNAQGNALFLILIAVALFAALSYAVTQSGRGGRDVTREQALILASQITQFGASVRTAVTRQIITGSSATSIAFDTTAASGTDEAFATDGGGAIYQDAPSDACASSQVCPTWKFLTTTDRFYVDNVGTDTGTSGDEDVIMYLSGVDETVCDEINSGLGLTLDQTENTAMDFATAPGDAAGANTFGDGGNAYAGEAFACTDSGGVNIYYHVLVER